MGKQGAAELNEIINQTTPEIYALFNSSNIPFTTLQAQIAIVQNILNDVANESIFPQICPPQLVESLRINTNLTQDSLFENRMMFTAEFSNIPEILEALDLIIQKANEQVEFGRAAGFQSIIGEGIFVSNPFMSDDADNDNTTILDAATLGLTNSRTKSLFLRRNVSITNPDPLYTLASPMQHPESGEIVLACANTTLFAQELISFTNLLGTEVVSAFLEILWLVLALEVEDTSIQCHEFPPPP